MKNLKLTLKWKFLLKAFLGGALLTKGFFGFSGSEITLIPVWLAVRDFIGHFSVVFMFWLIIPEKLRPTKWLSIGLLGSLIFSSGFLVIVWILYNYNLPIGKVSQLILLERVIFGALGAIPQWFLLRKKYQKASLWLVANGVGFAFAFSPYTISRLGLSSLTKTSNLVIDQWLMAIAGAMPFYIGYGLLGLSLGLCFYEYIDQSERQEGELPAA